MRTTSKIRLLFYGTLVGTLAVTMFTGYLGRRLTYLPPPIAVPSPAPAPFTEVKLDAGGSAVVGWWADGGTLPGRPALVFFGGNGANLESYRQAGILGRFLACGTALLAVDYPGYGLSEGTPSEAAIARAADSALAWLRERHPERPRIAAGQSLGAAVAVSLADRHPGEIRKLLLLSPFTSLADAARAHYPGWLVALGLQERYDSLQKIPSLTCPVLILHGDRDRIIPIEQGRRLARAAKAGRFVEAVGSDHNDLTDADAVWEAIRAFLQAEHE